MKNGFDEVFLWWLMQALPTIFFVYVGHLIGSSILSFWFRKRAARAANNFLMSANDMWVFSGQPSFAGIQ